MVGRDPKEHSPLAFVEQVAPVARFLIEAPVIGVVPSVTVNDTVPVVAAAARANVVVESSPGATVIDVAEVDVTWDGWLARTEYEPGGATIVHTPDAGVMQL